MPFDPSPKKAWYQCTELIVRYETEILGFKTLNPLHTGAQAAQIFANNSGGTFTFVNGANAADTPSVGAVLSLGAFGRDTVGHVGIAQAVEHIDATHRMVTLFDQNLNGEYNNGTWKKVAFTLTNGVWVGTASFKSGNAVSISPVVGWAQPSRH